jgi:membrane protease YdiL (CAAX protease family)
MTENIDEVENNKKEKKEAIIALFYPFLFKLAFSGAITIGILQPPNFEAVWQGGEVPLSLVLFIIIEIFQGILALLILKHWGYGIGEAGLKVKNVSTSALFAFIGIATVYAIFFGPVQAFLIKYGYLNFEYVQVYSEFFYSLRSLSPGRLLINTLYWLTAVGFSEEVVYRGFIQSRLQRVTSPLKAIVISSFIFMLFHINTFELVPLLFRLCRVFMIGFVFGFTYYRTDNLLGIVIIHGLMDGIIGAGLILCVLKLFFPV